jgi:hypothetical protein
MAIFNIFKNNIKTVIRNWIYLVILIICPIILIAVAGVMLKSVDFKNIPVGIVESNATYQLDKSFFNHVRIYPSLDSCFADISASQIGMCIYSYEGDEKHNVDVYIDNRKRIVEYYAKQIVLEKFSAERFYFFEQSAKDVEQRLNLFSSSINSSKKELYNAYYELDEQEKKLGEYQKNLTIMRRDFNEVYSSLKEVQPQIEALKQDLNSDPNSVSGNLSVIKQRRAEIESNMGTLKYYLKSRLSPTDYTYVETMLDDALNDLKDMEASLEEINESYSDPDLKKAVNNLDSAIDQMDSIKSTLDQLDIDLQDSIVRTRESKERIHLLIQNINEEEMQIGELSDKLGEKGVFIQFRSPFEKMSDDPILISFPLLIAIIATFTSMVLSNLFILKQTGQRSYLRETLSPAWDLSFLISAYLTNLFFIFVQVITLLIIGFFLFHTAFFNSLSIVIFAIFLAVSVFILIGMIIGYLVKNQNLSILLSVFLVILFFVFSDILAPTALTSPIIQFFINLNPFVILNNILFDAILINSPFSVLRIFFTKLEILFGVLSIVVYLSRKINKRRFFKEE